MRRRRLSGFKRADRAAVRPAKTRARHPNECADLASVEFGQIPAPLSISMSSVDELAASLAERVCFNDRAVRPTTAMMI